MCDQLSQIQVNCCFCGKDLTDGLSQERGYGPICALKYGMAFDTTAPMADNVVELLEAAVASTSEERRNVAERARECYDTDKKKAAKRLAWLLSHVTSPAETDVQLQALYGLGFHAMAGLIACQRASDVVPVASKRKCEVMLLDTQYGRQIAVRTPCKPKGDGMERERELQGRRWDPRLRVVRYPLSSWDAVMSWVLTYFPLSDIPERPTTEIEAAVQAQAQAPQEAVKKVRLSLLSKRIAIESPYDKGFVDEIKALPDRLWMCLECGKPGRPKCEDHPKGQHVWTVPLDRAEQVKDLVKRYFPEAEHTVSSQLSSALAVEDRKVQAAHAVVAPIVELPGGMLYPFQGAGVRYLETANGNAIIADEQGLGKTVQAIAYAKRNVAFDRGEMVLYVVPSNVKYNWASEILHWLAGTPLNDTKLIRRLRREGRVQVNGVEVSVLAGKPNGNTTSCVAQHVIVNYDVLSAWEDILKAAGYALIVADEAHNLKNEKAGRTKAFEAIASGIARKVLLTGTPVLNRPRDLWNLLKIIDSDTWHDFFKFHKRYTNAEQKWAGRAGYKWDFSGASNTDELHSRLDGHQWIRRLKSDVLKDLPPKQRTLVPLDIDETSRRAYERVERECAKMLPTSGGKVAAAQDMDRDERAVVIAQITRLRVAVGEAKVKAVCDWVEDLVESVGKVVVFAHHRSVVGALAEKFNALRIDGSVSPAKRTEIVAEFQSNPEARVIVCSIQAASVGITLTAAHHVVLAERVWRAKDHDQAEDRCHRIGTTESVTAWYLDVPDTFDEAMRAINDWKAKVADEIVDGTEEAEAESALQMALDYFAEKAG
jgi:SWI/SNF-related matrix-associated actin-dependent regulator 1 of chromatin subfamily A